MNDLHYVPFERPFGVVYADPPWRFGDALPGPGRGATKHYATMTVADIKAVPMPPLAADAWLFLWRVAAMQREALEVIEAWGFGEPKAEIVWVKTTKAGNPHTGMGRSVRNSHEVCLIAKRGKPERASASEVSVVLAPRQEHSRKPDEVAEKIERLTQRCPRLELFARRHRPGWYTHGLELYTHGLELKAREPGEGLGRSWATFTPEKQDKETTDA